MVRFDREEVIRWLRSRQRSEAVVEGRGGPSDDEEIIL